MFSLFKSVLARARARAAVGNFAWLVGEKVVRLALGVVVGFWVARYLGPARFGAYSYAMAIVGIAVMVTEGGMEGVLKRELLVQAERAPALFAAVGIIRLCLGALGYLGLCGALAAGWGGTSEERSLLAVAGLLLFQPLWFTPDVWFQVRLQSRISVITQLVALACGAALRLTLIQREAGLTAFAWAAVGEAGVAGLLLAWRARAAGMRIGIGPGLPDLMRKLWQDAWPLLASGIAVAVYIRIDAVMLRQMSGEGAVGIYAAGIKFTEVWFFFPGALAASLLPGIIRARAEGPDAYARRLQRYCALSAVLAYGLTVPTALAAPWLVRWAYGQAFIEAVPVLMVHTWVLVFAALGVARGQYCINEGHTRFHLWATIAGAAVNVLLNLWLIPRHGPFGAAIATLVAQMVAAWLSSFCFAPIRSFAWMQTRALVTPVRAFRHTSNV
ncbi:MAG: flippase [Verrucomicrobiota bacterium]